MPREIAVEWAANALSLGKPSDWRKKGSVLWQRTTLARFDHLDDDFSLLAGLVSRVVSLFFGGAEYGELTANDFDRSRRFDSQSHPVASNPLDDHHDSPANHQMLSDFSTEYEHDSLPE